MESQHKNPEFRNIPENFHPCEQQSDLGLPLSHYTIKIPHYRQIDLLKFNAVVRRYGLRRKKTCP